MTITVSVFSIAIEQLKTQQVITLHYQIYYYIICAPQLVIETIMKIMNYITYS